MGASNHDSDEGRKAPPKRKPSRDEQILANIALTLGALSVDVSRAAGVLASLAGPERTAYREALSLAAGAIAEQLHDFRRLVRLEKER